MPFDQTPEDHPPRRERVFIFAIRAPELKAVIVDAALAGQITEREAEDLIAEYGLRHK